MNYQEFIQPFYNSETKTSGLRGVQSQGETAEYFVDLAFAHEIPEKYISQPDTYRRWYTGRSNPKSTLWKEIEKAFDDKRFEEYSKELAAKIDDEKLIDLLLAYDIKLALGKKANKKYFAEALTYQFKAIANGKGSADEIVKQTYYSKEKPAVFGEYIRKAKETYSRMTVLGGKKSVENPKKLRAQSFLHDVCATACMMYEEDTDILYIDPGFQEYLFARYYAFAPSNEMKELCNTLIDQSTTTFRRWSAFRMLYEYSSDKVEVCLFIPFLDRIFKDRDDRDSFLQFIKIGYKELRYTVLDQDLIENYMIALKKVLPIVTHLQKFWRSS